MPQKSKELDSKTLAHELCLLSKRYSSSTDAEVLQALEVINPIQKHLSLGKQYFKIVVEFFQQFDEFLAEKLGD